MMGGGVRSGERDSGSLPAPRLVMRYLIHQALDPSTIPNHVDAASLVHVSICEHVFDIHTWLRKPSSDLRLSIAIYKVAFGSFKFPTLS